VIIKGTNSWLLCIEAKNLCPYCGFFVLTLCIMWFIVTFDTTGELDFGRPEYNWAQKTLACCIIAPTSVEVLSTSNRGV
jgi:hypothetical protein